MFFFLDRLTLEGGTDSLSRNVGMEWPLYAKYNPSRARISELNLLKIKSHGNGYAHGTGFSPNSSFANLEGEEN
jgi:hypothetical protein